jgi:N-acetylneuraminic acid mutarotase
MIQQKTVGVGLEPLPKLLHHVGAAVVGGKIYVIGGYIIGSGPVATVYEYDPAANRWNVRKSMPTARGALAVGVFGERIHAIGGVGVDGKNTPAHEE